MSKKTYVLGDSGPFINCPRCGEQFQQRYATQRYCNPVCARAKNTERMRVINAILRDSRKEAREFLDREK